MRPAKESSFSSSTRSPSAMFALLLAVGAAGCAIHPDPEFPPPIAPLAPDQRMNVAVAVVENATPSAVIAEWSFPTRLYVGKLLERTRRFHVVEAGETASVAGTLYVRYTDVRDEPFLETLVFNAEQQSNRKRRAVVEMDWKLVSATGGATKGSALVSDEFREGPAPLLLPTLDQFESGSFWETPYGIATRENLDSMVRQIASGP